MENKFQHIDPYLLLNFIKGECNDREKERVELWLEADPNNQNLLDSTKRIWDHSSSLEDIEQINVEADWQLVRDRIKSGTHQEDTNYFGRIIRIAATVVLALGLGYTLFQFWIEDPEILVVKTNDQQREITLDDGTKVWLNRESQLAFPETFVTDQREVRLLGEAYFEVIDDKDKPFTIVTQNEGIVEVIGTAFNVEASVKSDLVIVDVVEGKVALYNADNPVLREELQVNERGVLERNDVSKSIVENQNFLSWKTGVLNFENSSLLQVIEDLEEHYGQEIRMEGGGMGSLKWTSVIRDQTLKEALDELALVLGLEYEVSDDSVITLKTNNNKQ